ncbi:MAG: acyl-CoA thioesterase [Alphaproteobacteria bacterium]|nr:acyl-CoA thioesterase [Alphaproteobacteria bacterium]
MTINFGDFKNGAHHFPVHIFWNATDAGGVVYYANYLKMAEEARGSLEKLFGPKPGEFMVRKCSVEYMKPARHNDDLMIRTTCGELKGASITIEQEVMRDEEILVKLSTTLVFVDLSTLKPARIPETYIAKLKEIKNEQ